MAQTLSAVEDGQELLMFLSLPPEYWHYSCVLPLIGSGDRTQASTPPLEKRIYLINLHVHLTLRASHNVYDYYKVDLNK